MYIESKLRRLLMWNIIATITAIIGLLYAK